MSGLTNPCAAAGCGSPRVRTTNAVHKTIDRNRVCIVAACRCKSSTKGTCRQTGRIQRSRPAWGSADRQVGDCPTYATACVAGQHDDDERAAWEARTAERERERKH